MKHPYLFLCISLAMCFNLQAQVPHLVNYQTVIRDVSGSVIPSQNVSIRLSILQGNITGTVVYQEVHQVTTNDFGLANTQLGGGIPANGAFNTIQWGTDAFFLRTELDLNGGSNFSLMGTQQLVSVPYALHAGTVSSSGLSQASVGCGDTLWTGAGNFIIVPGISDANGVSSCTHSPTGTYLFDLQCDGFGNCSGLSEVTLGQNQGEYLITQTGTACAGLLPMTFTIDGQGSITIPPQVYQNVTIQGSGTLSNNILSLSYTLTEPSLGPIACVFTGVLQ